MKKILLIVIAIISVNYVTGQTLEPVKRQIGKLVISVDPRLELLSTIQVLADYPFVSKEIPYAVNLTESFASMTGHKATRLTTDLMNNNGFRYNAPVEFMLYLSQPYDLKQKNAYPDDLIARAGKVKNLEEYRKAIKDFAIKGKFADFWERNIPFYSKMVDLTVSDACEIDWVEAIEKYYNQSQNSYTITMSPVFDFKGYGPRVKIDKDKYDVYACLSTVAVKDNIPYLDKSGLSYYVWHEFSHSFVNDEVAKYRERLIATQRLFDPIETVMSKAAYNDWEVCVYEHFVRAVNIRLIEKYFGCKEAAEKINEELMCKFIYIEPILDELKKFEELRDTKGITFAQYMPTLLNVFDELLKTDYSAHPALSFYGPIKEVLQVGTKTAIIYPTNDPDTTALLKVKRYTKTIYDMLSPKLECILISDKEALDKDLSQYAIMVYGTLESNLFLNKIKHTFPFRIENGVLYADKEYSDKNIRFISCFPNPQNKDLGMIVFTALSNNDVVGINSIFCGLTDYVVSDNTCQILCEGYYKKNKEWSF